jgi:hypothetical protein
MSPIPNAAAEWQYKRRTSSAEIRHSFPKAMTEAIHWDRWDRECKRGDQSNLGIGH